MKDKQNKIQKKGKIIHFLFYLFTWIFLGLFLATILFYYHTDQLVSTTLTKAGSKTIIGKNTDNLSILKTLIASTSFSFIASLVFLRIKQRN